MSKKCTYDTGCYQTKIGSMPIFYDGICEDYECKFYQENATVSSSAELGGYKDEEEALGSLEKAARYLYFSGWTASEIKKAVGQHRLLSGDECLEVLSANWKRESRPSL